MAATRPAVLVFQEFATLSTGAATPELNCLIAGPAYAIRDFPDERAKADKGASIQLSSNYGTLNAAATGSSVAPVGNDAVVTLQPPGNALGALLDSASVRVFFGTPRVEFLNAHGVDGTIVAGTPTMTSATDFAAAGVQPGDVAILTNNAGSGKQIRKIRTVATTTLTFTSDVGAVIASAGDTGVALVNAANTKFRIERTLPDTLIDASFHDVSGNEIDVNGSVTILVNGVAQLVTFAEVFIGYRSIRQDLAEVASVNSVTEIAGQFGLIDARNPLAVGLFTALSNSAASIQAFAVQSDDAIGYAAMQSAIANRKDVYAVVPLIQSASVVKSLASAFENLADPDFAVTEGVSQKFRMVIGAPTVLPTTKTVIDTNADGKVEQFGSALSAIRTLTIVGGADFIVSGVKPGDTLVISNFPANNGTYTVAHVNSATSLEVTTSFPSAANDATTTIVITRGLTSIVASVSVDATTAALDALFLDLTDANGTFIDDGVLPGDFIEMPTDPSLTSFATSVKLQIETIVSNQRVRIKDNGSNTALANNELPHGVTRTGTPVAVSAIAALHYRVVRTLSKDGQVTELMSVAQSIKSRRAVICWPDLIDVAGLTDGSLARDPLKPTTASPAASQPGFYLACAVGGMVASLPSHQGLTNLGIAGVSKLYDANTYFDDKQMTNISNSGWLVFQQDTPSALPFIIHQLTTDPSTLEFGELSLVKNFDFVSLFFSDILDDFLGIWNINDETIGFINAALDAGIENLKLRRRVRIGAPIIDGRITSVAESAVSSDRLEAFLEIDFPKPLNTIGLHLVSI